jgi:NAD-dependent deacetylase
MVKLVILTGAGISAESGLPTFRGPDGLWEGRDPLSLATPEAFAREPEVVSAFYTARRRALLDEKIRPNAAHEALVELERRLGDAFLLVTQNVDDLHQRAGSRRLLPMHGELLRSRCTGCGEEFGDRRELAMERSCPACGRSGRLRPAVVWFGEVPLHLEEIAEAVRDATHFVAIGTSGMVYPAAGLAALARSVGAHTVEINPAPGGNPAFAEVLAEPATLGVPAWSEAFAAALQAGER